MSGIFGSSQWMYASGFYNGVATQSLRFNDDDTAYLSRTPSSASNQKTWTYSTWFKIANNTYHTILSAGVTGTPRIALYMTSDGQLITDVAGTGSYDESVARFRDASAWYHLVWAFDTTQATGSNRSRMYINGTEITLTKTRTWSLDTNYAVNGNVLHTIGTFSNSIGSFNSDKYQAETNFVDGSQLTPTSFGETKNGVWIPIEYTGSYGTNGFRLQFNQTGTGTASSSTIGADTSGNANHFSSSGIVASDCDMPDSPENNWSTMNSLINGYGTNITMSEGNLAGTGTSEQYNNTLGTILMTSGKWYWEISSADFNNYDMLGIAIETAIQTTDSTPYGQTGVIAYATQGAVYNESASGTGSYTSFQASEIIGIAVDLDASPRTFKFYNNNTLQGTINLSSNFDNVGILPFFCIGNTDTIKVNFGQDSSFAGLKTAQGNTDGNVGDFYYSPPSGYLALCTANLPEPTISPNADTQADDYFNTVLYTGTGDSNSQSVTGVGFQPNFLWIKTRSTTYYHYLFDIVRGSGTNHLYSNTSEVEGTWANNATLTSFDSDGFTVGATPAYTNALNNGSQTFVAWNWKAGGTAVSNTNGSITSSVSANTDAGFSIVAYQGNDASSATVGHGLSQAPEMVIVKNRQEAITNPAWAVYHSSLGATKYIDLSTTTASDTATTVWNDTAPTSTVVTIGTADSVNSGSTHIMYCFHSVVGYSKFGSYTGNGSTDGPFVYLGFRPAWLMYKCSSSSGDGWSIWDAKRDTINGMDRELLANSSNAEGTATDYIDFVSNGFKIRASGGSINLSGGTFIYMAFAENPFKYANAR